MFQHGWDAAVADDRSRVVAEPNPERLTDIHLTLDRVNRALAGLGPKKARVVYLHDVLGYELGEVATMIGTTVAAAQSVFKSHDEAALAVIDGALAKETNKAAKAAFTEARSAILLYKSDASDVEKLEAVAVLKARGAQEAMALLTGLVSDAPPPTLNAPPVM